MTPERCVVKLGGSVITHKAADRPSLNERALERIAREMASVGPDRWPVALVHGAGSYGHLIVSRTRFCERLEDPEALLVWGKTQVLQNELSILVAEHLLAAGIPAVPFQASAVSVLQDGRLVHFHDRALRRLAARGLVPVLGGVPAADEVRGCAILSGDLLAPAVARALGVRRLALGTDVAGVFDRDPRRHPEARLVSVVCPENWEQVREGLTGSTARDVTGGMAAKVAALLEEARSGLEAVVFDATIPGAVAAVLQGETLGTRITATPREEDHDHPQDAHR